MNQLEYIQQAIEAKPDQRIMFDTGIVVKSSPHIPVFTCWGACSGPDGVFLMDYEGRWHGPLNRNQVFGPLVIASVYQRLKSLELVPSIVLAKYDNEVNAVIFE